MTVCKTVLLAVGITVLLAQPAAAQSKAPDRTPMLFYVAKGGPDACGAGCSEWIAAEGYIDPHAARRFRAFLKPLRTAKLPVFFQSQGGIQGQAVEMGRIMRERAMTAGVSRTLPEGCAKVEVKACQALKRSGRPLPAELRNVASCNSACVYAVIGAKVREIPPGATLGVHASKLVQIREGRVVAAEQISPESKRRMSSHRAQLRKYVKDMGIDPGLVEAAYKIPHEQIHKLSRDEIAAFGIDARGFMESRWTIVELPGHRPFVVKFIAEAKGTERKEVRTSVIQLSCAGPRRLNMVLSRGLASHEIGRATSISLSAAGRILVFPQTGSGRKIDMFDTGGLFDNSHDLVPFEYFDEAAAAGGIDMTEGDLKAEVPPARQVKLSTQGLPEAIKALRQQCAGGV
jgi:hypothetical protein